MSASKNYTAIKQVVAVLIAIAALWSVFLMWDAEGAVVLKGSLEDPTAIVKQFNDVILPGIKRYSFAIGLALLAASVSFILIDGEDELATASDESQFKQ